MRTFSFHQRGAVIRTLKEPKNKKKKINFDQLIYFGILSVLIFFLGRYTYTKLTIIEGNGQILMEKVDVNFTQDIRLQDMSTHEGDTVKIHQRLFSYKQSTFDNDASLVLQAQQSQKNAKKNHQKLALEIRKKRIQLNAALEQLETIKMREQQLVKLVMLDVYTKDKLDAIQLQIEEKKIQIKLLKSELYVLNQQKKTLPSTTSSVLKFNGSSTHSNTYTSPINGVIGQILKNGNEACYKTENVMTIHNTDVVFIKAYFALEALENVRQGQIVKLFFPDNSVSKGIINKVYIATYEVPEEFQKTYEPTERNILTEIIPLDDAQKSKWASYHKLNVKVEIDKL